MFGLVAFCRIELLGARSLDYLIQRVHWYSVSSTAQRDLLCPFAQLPIGGFTLLRPCTETESMATYSYISWMTLTPSSLCASSPPHAHPASALLPTSSKHAAAVLLKYTPPGTRAKCQSERMHPPSLPPSLPPFIHPRICFHLVAKMGKVGSNTDDLISGFH